MILYIGDIVNIYDLIIYYYVQIKLKLKIFMI